MNNNIIFLIIIFLFSLLLSSYSSYSSYSSIPVTEGFESYNTCIEQGYPMDFCMETPIQSKIDNEYSSSTDGYFGSWQMIEGSDLLLHKINKPYQSKPFDEYSNRFFASGKIEN